jgi:hypothetical protein
MAPSYQLNSSYERRRPTGRTAFMNSAAAGWSGKKREKEEEEKPWRKRISA